MKTGNKITKLRKEKGLSQEDLAQELNVSHQSISRWELNEALPDAINLKSLSKVFGVSVDYLLDEEKDEFIDETIPEDGFDKGVNLVKKHWAKIGYYFIVIGGIGTLVTTLIKIYTKSAIDSFNSSLGDNFFTFGTTFQVSEPMTGFIGIGQILFILVLCLGIGLIIIDRIKNSSRNWTIFLYILPMPLDMLYYHFMI